MAYFGALPFRVVYLKYFFVATPTVPFHSIRWSPGNYVLFTYKCTVMTVENDRGNPWVNFLYPYPYPLIPLPL
jgi:hypothetical protein